MMLIGCPAGSPDPLTIGLSISGAIFLLGLLLLLIWKLLTMLYDNMEYSRFESEIQNPVWERVSYQSYYFLVSVNYALKYQYNVSNS